MPQQPKEEVVMQRFGTYAMSLVFMVAVWVVPAGAQDKFVMGYGNGT